MLAASQSIRDAIASDHLVVNLLVKFTRGSDEWLLTDAPNDITTGSDTYSASDGLIKSVALPELRESLSRDLQQIVLVDDQNGTWIERFKQFINLDVEMRLIFTHNNAYTDTLLIFKGRCIGSKVETTKDKRELLLVAAGPFPQVDGEHEAYTNDANQRTRDPTDTAFIHTGLVREFTWGKR